jgi:hypothetical protein
MKNYEIKIYQLDGTFKKTVSVTERVNNISFSSQINGGQGEAQIVLNTSFADSSYTIGDIAKIYCYSDIYTSGKLIYTGSIQRITRTISWGIETVALTCIGIASMLQFILFTDGTLNQDPSDTIEDIIDVFETKYSGIISYAWGKVDTYGTNISNAFLKRSCLDSINDITKTTNFWWYIGADGEVYFKAKQSPTQFFTIGKDVDSIEVQEDGERIINNLIVAYTGWTKTTTDAGSVTAYGQRDKYESKTELQNVGSATEYSDSTIAENKEPKTKITITVNDNWTDSTGTKWIEDILPWMTISVRNSEYSMTNLQVRKVAYNINTVRLDLYEFDTLAKELLS